MSASLTLTPGAEVFADPVPLALELGGTLHGVRLGYELVGPPGAPVVLVQGGISAGRHVAPHDADPSPGWWDACVGQGRPVDTRRFRVLGIDWLGGAGASSGPRPGQSFPRITPHDQARATRRLLDALGVARLHAIAGASYGGMVALAFAALYPATVGRLVVLNAAHESHPFATAWRSLQRRVIALGLAHGCGGEALAIARGMGMLSYRSAAEFAARFAAVPEPGGETVRFPCEGYLEARGSDFARRFPPEAILTLSLAIDLFRVEPERIARPVTLIGARSDWLVPPEQIEALARRLAGPVSLHLLDSLYGHDSFLKEAEQLAPLLRGALEASR